LLVGERPTGCGGDAVPVLEPACELRSGGLGAESIDPSLVRISEGPVVLPALHNRAVLAVSSHGGRRLHGLRVYCRGLRGFEFGHDGFFTFRASALRRKQSRHTRELNGRLVDTSGGQTCRRRLGQGDSIAGETERHQRFNGGFATPAAAEPGPKTRLVDETFLLQLDDLLIGAQLPQLHPAPEEERGQR
jgi:hypothetical protein